MTRPTPNPTPTEQPFYDACQRGELLLQHCDHCGHVVFYPAPTAMPARVTRCRGDRRAARASLQPTPWCAEAFLPISPHRM